MPCRAAIINRCIRINVWHITSRITRVRNMHILSMCIRDVHRIGFNIRVRSTRTTSSVRSVCRVTRVRVRIQTRSRIHA